MNQILLQPEEIMGDGEVCLRGRRADHMREVLQVATGDWVRIGILNGDRGQGCVQSVTPESVVLKIVRQDAPLPATGISLVLALPRPKALKRLWPLFGELGVERVWLTNAAKVERVYFDTHWLQSMHYEPLLHEGLEQSGETHMPEVRVCRQLKPLVEDELAGEAGRKVILHPQGAPLSGLRFGDDCPRVVAVGPEGGWTDYEVDLFRRNGFECARLGSRILRSTTAVIAAVTGLMVDGKPKD